MFNYSFNLENVHQLGLKCYCYSSRLWMVNQKLFFPTYFYVLQTCKADGLVQTWDIETSKLLSKIHLDCQVHI